MEYPLHIDLNLIQDDFIQVDILEQAVDARQAKEDYLKIYKYRLAGVALLGAVMAALVIKGVILPASLAIPAFALLIFTVAHYFNKSGVDREFNFGVSHLLENREGHQFFSEEKGMALFYEDKCEFLTNEQRRYFDYDKIKHIKVTQLLYIFVMKKSKDKNMRGFAYMIIPKRCLEDGQREQLDEICNNIVEKYALTEWTDSKIMG